MPLDGKNTVNDLIKSEDNLDSKGIKVTKVIVEDSNLQNRNSSVTCVNGATGNDADNGHYVAGEITHRKYNTYVYEYVCAYDSAYYTCWYQTTSGMSYEDKLHACCPRQPVQRRNSELYTKINSRTSCGFTLFFLCLGDESIDVDRLRIRGMFRQYKNGTTYETLYNESGYNTAYFTHVLYDGTELLSGVFVQTDFTSFWYNPYTYQNIIYGCSLNFGI